MKLPGTKVVVNKLKRVGKNLKVKLTKPKMQTVSLPLLNTLCVNVLKTRKLRQAAPQECRPSWKFGTAHFTEPHAMKVKLNPDPENSLESAGAGEDSCFVTSNSMGVADGVGGWSFIKGASASLYSRLLMHFTKICMEAEDLNDPVKAMTKGCDLVTKYQEETGLRGSSTACVVCLKDRKLLTANLGDSGFLIIRNKKILAKSREQSHDYNFPFQLGSGSKDHPKHSKVDSFDLKLGDIVLLASDGLFDNLFDTEILELVVEYQDQGMDVVCEQIAEQARLFSLSTRLSPFAKGYKAHTNIDYQGGKEDDICVVAGFVQEKEVPKDSQGSSTDSGRSSAKTTTGSESSKL